MYLKIKKAEGGTFSKDGDIEEEDINPANDLVIKARLALDSHFGNPTARRMTNYDTRSYNFKGNEEDELGPVEEEGRGNVFVGSYGKYVTPHIQDVDGNLTFISYPWSDENSERTINQSMKFETEDQAEYFGKHYKRFAPMMSLYDGYDYKDEE